MHLSNQIQQTGKYSVIDRMQRENILSELHFSNSGCTDESCQLEIGRLLSARKVIVGSIGVIGNLKILNVKLIDVETGATINSASRNYADMNEMIIKSDELVSVLLDVEYENKTPIDVTQIKGAWAETGEERKADYSETVPWIDLGIPGFSHFQAGNPLMGVIYLAAAAGGAGLLGFSEYKYSVERGKYGEAQNSVTTSELYKSSELWRNLSIAGAGVWGAAAIASTIHAMIAKGGEGD